ncbi:MAG: response regulator, partial [Pseudomonadota bacterium]|nr:response regulator [Pseudomonadota bacterium]
MGDRRPLRVLIVDDNPADVRLLERRLLAAEGWRIDASICADPNECLGVVRQHTPQLVFVDYRLAGVKGTDLIGELVRMDRFAPYCILLTGHGGEAVVLDALRAGARDYLRKDELDVAAVERALRHFRIETEMAGRLRESQDQFSKLVRLAADGICILQHDRVLFVNDKFCRMMNHSAERLTSQPLDDHFDPAIVARFRDNYARRLAGDATLEDRVEMAVRSGDGEELILDIGFAVIEQSGEPALMLIARDITQRRRVEAEVQRHRDHLAEMVEARTT